MSVLFSIIIPVYNVKEYLYECVSSIYYQDYNNFEIILVDDGSTDGSGELCEKIAKEYNQIKIIHKKNGGSADARNKGIELSQGEYLLFLDSDDFWENKPFLNKLEKIIKEKDPDLIRFGVKQIDFENSQILSQSNFNEWEYYNTIEKPYPIIINDGQLTISACLHAVKREYIIKNKIYFKSGLLCEDIEWGIRLFAPSPSIYYLPINIYNYRYRRPGSHTSNTDEKTLLDYCKIIENGFKYVQGKNSEDWLSGYLMYQTIIAIAHTNYQKINVKAKIELNSRFKEIVKEKISKYRNLKKIRVLYFIYRYLGYRIMSIILGLYLSMRGR